MEKILSRENMLRALQAVKRNKGAAAVNYLISPKLLETENKKKGRPALVNPLAYYLGCLQ